MTLASLNLNIQLNASDDAIDRAAAHRYRESVPNLRGHWNETLAVILNHRSVRHYLTRPLEAGIVETLIAAAQSAPSSSNVQAWSVVAIEDPEQKARFAAYAGNQKHILDAPLLLVWIADLARVNVIAEAEGTSAEGGQYLEGFLVSAFDATFAAQNALVAAESLGLGTCYIGALRNRPLEVAEDIGLPPRTTVVFGLTVGYPDPKVETGIKPRLPQEAVLHRGRYSLEAQQQPIARHDDHSLNFRREQKLDATPWRVLALNRLRDAAALKGRHVLKEKLEKLGFEFK
jgi:nitroreductase